MEPAFLTISNTMTVAFDPIALSLFGLEIRWYGLLWLLAAAQFAYVARRYAPRLLGQPLDAGLRDDLLFAVMAGSLLGGRLGYALFYGWDQALRDALWILRFWEGGMSFHGGLAGVLLACWWVARRKRIPILRLGDVFALGVPLGLGLGRLGNFINGELWGRPTELAWGMVFPAADTQPRHPSQLYELIAEGPLLFVLLLLVLRRPHVRPGEVGAAFLLGYGALRFGLEFLREPDAHLGLLLGGLSAGQLLCLPMLAAGGVVLYYARRPAS